MNSPEVLRVGRVIEVDGAKVLGQLEAQVDDLYRVYQSRKYTIGQIGSIVKIEAGDTLVFGIVTSLRMLEVGEQARVPTAKDGLSASKWIEIELLGQGVRKGLAPDDFDFARGVSTYPLPGQNIYVATSGELRQIFSLPDEPTVAIGSVSQSPGLPVHLKTNRLLGRHFAILGTTGAGKSCAVALLVGRLISQVPPRARYLA